MAAVCCYSTGKTQTLRDNWSRNQDYREPRRLEIWWCSVFIKSNQNTACSSTNLVASAFVVVDPGHHKSREENNMPIRIEKNPIISYPSLSETDFRRMPFPIPVKITNAKDILTILLLLILVYWVFLNTQKYTFLIVRRKQWKSEFCSVLWQYHA